MFGGLAVARRLQAGTVWVAGRLQRELADRTRSHGRSMQSGALVINGVIGPRGGAGRGGRVSVRRTCRGLRVAGVDAGRSVVDASWTSMRGAPGRDTTNQFVI